MALVQGDEAGVLFVADVMPWPADSGYRLRTAMCLEAALEVAPVDLFAAPRGPSPATIDDSVALARRCRAAVVHPVPDRSRPMTAMRWMVHRDLPWALGAADWRGADQQLRHGAGRQPALVVAMGIDAWRAARRAGISAAAWVVDTDVESAKLASRLAAGAVGPGLQRVVATRDVRRWRSLEARVAQSGTTFSLCSEDEARLIPGPTWVTPNAVADPGPPVPRRPRHTLLFVGSLGYRPNEDGLEYFVTDVLPLIRSVVPECRLVVVGDGLTQAAAARRDPGTEIRGRVADISAVFREATAMVVPIRWGGGTRVKIVESFAHGVPVVATPVGAAGLSARSGVEFLAADDPVSFARACVDLLTDAPLRERLVAAAYQSFRRHHDSSRVRAELAGRLAGLLQGGS